MYTFHTAIMWIFPVNGLAMCAFLGEKTPVGIDRNTESPQPSWQQIPFSSCFAVIRLTGASKLTKHTDTTHSHGIIQKKHVLCDFLFVIEYAACSPVWTAFGRILCFPSQVESCRIATNGHSPYGATETLVKHHRKAVLQQACQKPTVCN